MKDRNGSGYFDPTADAAIHEADRKPRRVVRVWRAPEESTEASNMVGYFSRHKNTKGRAEGDEADDGGEAKPVG